MDKKTAQNLIEGTFNDSFSEEKFIRFSQELLNDIDFSHGRNWSTLIYDDFEDKISKYKRVGLYTDPEGNELEVLIIEVQKIQMLDRARTSMRNFVIKWLQSDKNKSKSRDYALVAFYSKEDNGIDWRFSFIKVEQTSFMDEEKGKVKTKKEFTPAKRYSFLVGKYEKAHTAKNQLLPLLQNIANNPTIEELEAAFSIEKVTDEFFSQYKDLYIKLFEHFENNSEVKAELDKASIDNARFTKKLLGQIVFLYFLQKKGWLGVAKNERWGKGKKRFVQELNEQAQAEGVNFFKDKLQYLFYEALAKERDNVNSYYERFDCRIPFLNGGLFEADYDWRNANITIPETLFRNEEKNKSGDIGTGVLDVFDRYNFTIKEDEPMDKEVAVDPEMLGKVFENMLDITERKSKGAFYTPREIVHYMCQESLIHYLDNSLNGSSPFKEEYPKGEVVKSSPPLKEEVVKSSPPSKGGEGVVLNNLPHLKTFRKALRNNLTPAEATLWKMLQGKQLDGRKFRRQHSVANYILDFYCPSEKLAIELDGQGHFEATQAEYDYERDLFLKHCGIKVLRFENKWVWDNPEGLLEEVKANFGWEKKQPPRPADTPPLKGGEQGVVVPKKDIETYIHEGHFALENDERVAAKGETKTYKYQLPESIRLNADLIDQKLSDIRICDPAIGSGAFPVGLLHELVNAMLVLKPHFSYDYLTKKLKGFGIEHRESVSESRYIYRLKRHIIQESIYGVDIDSSAIDIARLRLWLSLVVDEDDLDPIETLPNLDYKIVCGNSLIGLPDGAMRNLQVEAELEKLKEDFYNITDESKKKALRQQINTKIRELLDSAEQFAGYSIDFDFKLFFSEVWREKGGFDVVIGNPPYVVDTTLEKWQKDFLIKNYVSAIYQINLYMLFMEQAFKLNKPNGFNSYIVPNTWLVNKLVAPFRKHLLTNCNLISIVDLTEEQVFDATVLPIIFTAINNKTKSELRIINGKDYRFVERARLSRERVLNQPNYLINYQISDEDWDVLLKIERNTFCLEEIAKSSFGVKFYQKGKGVPKQDENIVSNHTFTHDEPIDETCLNILEGKNIDRFYFTPSNKYIQYGKWLAEPRDEEMFVGERVLVRRIVGQTGLIAAYVDGHFCNNSLLHVVKPHKVSSKALAALLNSDLIGYYFIKKFARKEKTFPEIRIHELNSLPVSKYFDSKILDLAYSYANESLKRTQPLLSAFFISVINSIIFELYFPEEIKSAGKEILKHLGDLKPITPLHPSGTSHQGEEQMSEEEKLAIIQSEFERLYDPNHPVRFAIETLDSVEEVRIIKEALK